jgi:hypothetical protein
MWKTFRLPNLKKKNFTSSKKILESDDSVSHIMAITLDPKANYNEGLVRVVVKREGDIVKGNHLDRSELRFVRRKDDKFILGDRVQMEGEEDLIKKLQNSETEFIGFEDPDIFLDSKTNLLHVYFTVPFVSKQYGHSRIHLGHAYGKDIHSLVITEPTILGTKNNTAKELSISPLNSHNMRYNLYESSDVISRTYYSVIKKVSTAQPDGIWNNSSIVFHPKLADIPWINGHASPGPLLSKNFIDMGSGKALGFINGKNADRKIFGRSINGTFSIGLFVYDYEKGEIVWVSKKPFLSDKKARIITFASQFIEKTDGEGELFAHIDDSYVNSYLITRKNLTEFLNEEKYI